MAESHRPSMQYRRAPNFEVPFFVYASFPSGSVRFRLPVVRLSNFGSPALQSAKRLCCGTQPFSRYASNGFRQSSHSGSFARHGHVQPVAEQAISSLRSRTGAFLALQAAFGTGFPRKSSRATGTRPASPRCKRQKCRRLVIFEVGSVFRRRKAERKLVFRQACRKIISGRTSVRPAAEKDEYQPV